MSRIRCDGGEDRLSEALGAGAEPLALGLNGNRARVPWSTAMAGIPPGLVMRIPRWSRRMNAWSALHIVLTAGLVTAGGLWVRGLEPVVETPPRTARPTATAMPTTPTPVPFRAELRLQETVYIVGSEAEAKNLRVVLENDGAVRFYYELRPLPDLVIVARTDEDAEALIEVLIEGNRMRVSMRQAEVRIVNLR